jgi:hypothetical protein
MPLEKLIVKNIGKTRWKTPMENTIWKMLLKNMVVKQRIQ